MASALLATPPTPAVEQEDSGHSILRYIFGYGFIFQILAIVHWARRGRDRFWIWIIIIGGVIGAAAYFLVEALPDVESLKRSFAGPARRKRIAALRAMIRDNPSAGNYEELGELLVQEKKWREARQAFDSALASRTDLLDTFYWRGVAAFEMGDDVAAIANFQHVVKANSKFAYSRALCLLGRSLARSGRTPEATSAFEQLVATTTAAESVVTAAEFLVTQQRYAAARDLIESVLARRATMPSYQKRQERQWLRKATALQRKLKKIESQPPATAA